MPAPWTQAGKTHLSEEMLNRLLASRPQDDAPYRFIILDSKPADPNLEVPSE